jgi:hypothetical protein
MNSALHKGSVVDENYIDVGTLRKLGVVSEDTAIVLVEHIDRDNDRGFTRQGFLEAMCDAHGVRMPDPKDMPQDLAAAA